MKICLISPSYPSAQCGISTYTSYLAEGLENIASVEIIGAAAKSGALGRLGGTLARNRPLQCDILHVQHAFDTYGYMGYRTIPFYQLLRRKGAPIVTTIHELPQRCDTLKDRIVYPYLQACIRTIAEKSDAVIVHTKSSVDLLIEWADPRKIYLIPHGTIVSPESQRHTSRMPTTGTIGFFGFVSPHKGIDRALEAVARLPGVRFVVAGTPRAPADHDYYRALQARANELGIADRVDFAGFVPDDAIGDFFRAVDLVVFPYLHCTASGALHIALAHQCTVLTSDLPIFRELAAAYRCLEMFDLHDADSFANQIRRLLSDSARRDELAAGRRRMIAATGWERVAKRTYAIYQRLSQKTAAKEAIEGTSTPHSP